MMGTTPGTITDRSGAGSRVVRWQLGRKLRALRVAAGMSLDDVAHAKAGSKGKLSRIESGQVPVSVPDASYLCQLYGCDEDTATQVKELAVGTDALEWWESYGQITVPDWFGLYVGMEAAATAIRAFDPTFVHGLLQTEDYARAVLSADPHLSADVIEKRVRFRLERQRAVLNQMPRLTVILGAGAVSLQVGGQDVLAAQVLHLRDLHRSGAVEVRIVPWSAGAYPNRGAYALLSFDQEEGPTGHAQTVAYTEVSGGARYVEQPAELEAYEDNFGALVRSSLTIEEYPS